MNGINSKDRFSFAKGYRARTIFLIFDILLLGILMCMMVLPLLKVIVDSIDPTSYGVRLWPRKIDFSAYEMILTTSSLYRPFLVSVLTTVVGTVTGLFIITMGPPDTARSGWPWSSRSSSPRESTRRDSRPVSSSSRNTEATNPTTPTATTARWPICR